MVSLGLVKLCVFYQALVSQSFLVTELRQKHHAAWLPSRALVYEESYRLS